MIIAIFIKLFYIRKIICRFGEAYILVTHFLFLEPFVFNNMPSHKIFNFSLAHKVHLNINISLTFKTKAVN